jgi:predicted lipoprotein with Yx(FWY)xxD motif
MSEAHPGHRRPRRSARSRPERHGLRILVLALAILAVPATLALARGRTTRHAPAPTVTAAHNAALGETIVVDGRGRTLYALSGETSHHLECSSATCLKFWPPLTVASAHTTLRAGAGVHGKLGLFRRANGQEQVTLRGLLLYRFEGDSRAGMAAGQGIASFGGVWHAVTASATSTGTSPSSGTGGGSTPGAPGTGGGSSGSPGYGSGATTSTSTATSVPGVTSQSVPPTSTATSSATTVSSQSTSSSTASTTSTYTYPYPY